MLVCWVHGCVYAKVYADTIAHQLLAVKRLPDLYRGFGVEERNYYAAKGLEWRPCVHSRMLVDCFANLGKGGQMEDFRVQKILNLVSIVATAAGLITYGDDESV